MVKVVFKNLNKSDIAEDIVSSKIEAVLNTFPEFKTSTATAILEMDNSRMQAGPDHFNIKLILKNNRYLPPIVFQHDASNVYQALSILTDRLFEVLHRAVDKRRHAIRASRRLAKEGKQKFIVESQAAS